MCGIVGIYAPGQPVSHLCELGLFALQHRGQESAGISVSDGATLTVQKDMGLVATVFDDRSLAALTGHLGIGHTRYSTTGSSSWRNAQPVYRAVGEAEFALGHNGNLVNTAELAEDAGMLPGTVTSDSDLVAELMAAELARDGHDSSDGRRVERALRSVVPHLRGAFSIVCMDEAHVIGLRDPNGIRPLCLGRMADGWVLASETPALDLLGAELVRELDPGEMVVIDATGVRSVQLFGPEAIDPKLCLFEFVYFSRPDSLLYERTVHSARVRMGELLAEQAPVDADVVMGVPESGLPAAEGYARRSGIPYGQGLVKNRYIGRTFIAPDQQARDRAVRKKLNPLRDTIAGRRLVVVDDSIVRGTTTRALVAMLREAGAAEVHLRISSPPYRWPCHYGLDTGKESELLAAHLDVDAICGYVGADTLAYIDLDRLVTATGAADRGFCTACVTGDYPVPLHGSGGKDVLEATETAVPEPVGTTGG